MSRKRNAEKRRIAEWEVEDIGVEHSQYFQGRGTSFTHWDLVEVGIGETFNDALEDALEQLAMSGDVAGEDLDEIAKEKVSEKENERVTVSTVLDENREEGDEEDDDGESELWYHVAVYVKWEGDDEEEDD